jgi:hypothetical protein
MSLTRRPSLGTTIADGSFADDELGKPESQRELARRLDRVERQVAALATQRVSRARVVDDDDDLFASPSSSAPVSATGGFLDFSEPVSSSSEDALATWTTTHALDQLYELPRRGAVAWRGDQLVPVPAPPPSPRADERTLVATSSPARTLVDAAALAERAAAAAQRALDALGVQVWRALAGRPAAETMYRSTLRLVVAVHVDSLEGRVVDGRFVVGSDGLLERTGAPALGPRDALARLLYAAGIVPATALDADTNMAELARSAHVCYEALARRSTPRARVTKRRARRLETGARALGAGMRAIGGRLAAAAAATTTSVSSRAALMVALDEAVAAMDVLEADTRVRAAVAEREAMAAELEAAVVVVGSLPR